MELDNEERIVVDAEQFEKFFNTVLEQNISKNYEFDENDTNFVQNIDINTVKIEKDTLNSSFVKEYSFLETKIEIEEHDLTTYLFDKETFYYSDDSNEQKDLDILSKSVINGKESENCFSGDLKQSIKKDCASTASNDCDGEYNESIDLEPVMESNINSVNFIDILGEASLNNAANESDLGTTSKSVINGKEVENFFSGELKQSIKKDCASTASSDCDGEYSESIDLEPVIESNINSVNLINILGEASLNNAANESDFSKTFTEEESKQLNRKIKRQLKRSLVVLLNKIEISNFNNEVEKCIQKKRNADLLNAMEDLFVHLQQQDLYELQKVFRRNQSQNNEPENSTRHCNNAGRPKTFHCPVCFFKNTIRFQLAVHIVENHKEVAKAKNMVDAQYMMPGSSPNEILFKCNECSYTSKRRQPFQSHLLTHKSVDECEQTFRCASCRFITKNKSLLIRHMLVHIPAKRRRSHKCPHCDFRTKHKIYIRKHVYKMHNPKKTKQKKSHMLIYKTPSKVVMYKCDFCPFSTKHKRGITRHRTLHEEVSEEDMIHCDLCPYKAKLKELLNRHMLTHKTSDKFVMCKCNLCQYSTKRTDNLMEHRKIHMEVPEEDMIPCSLCPYKAKLKKTLKRHMLVHKAPDEVVMYKCDLCPFSTKHKVNLTLHQKVHKEEIISCSLCPYKTKLPRYLKKHSLVHKKLEESEMFRCAQCLFCTKTKQRLKIHIKRHERQLLDAQI